MSNYKLALKSGLYKEVSLWNVSDNVFKASSLSEKIKTIESDIINQPNFNVFKYQFVSHKILEDAKEYIEKHDLNLEINRGCDLVSNNMQRLNLDFDLVIDISKDIESPEWESLRLLVEVYTIDYRKLLNIWNDISNQFYSDLNPEKSKQIYIVFRKKKKRVTYIV